jgi:hypothetical protein
MKPKHEQLKDDFDSFIVRQTLEVNDEPTYKHYYNLYGSGWLKRDKEFVILQNKFNIAIEALTKISNIACNEALIAEEALGRINGK